MRYLGGKVRIAARVVGFLESIRQGREYVEPFVGSANVFHLMSGPKRGSDINPDLIMLLEQVRDGTFDYPDYVSEETYTEQKCNPDPSAMRAFVGFGCSFAGKWFGGYARSGDRNYATNAAASLKRKAVGLQGAALTCIPYSQVQCEGSLIYCDPPYQGTTQLYGGKFYSSLFWDKVREWSACNLVIVSEYQAPQDFECVMEIPTVTDIKGVSGRMPRVERLFKFRT